MDYQLTGKTALITGASKGIGFAIAQGLAAEGVRVVLSARGQSDLYKAAEYIRADGGDATGLVADVGDPQGIDALFEEVKKIALPDILVVNAGGPPAGLPSTLSQEAWAKGYDLTLMSAVRLAYGALPAMRERGWGRIINVTSLSVKEPINTLTLSNAFRAAVTGFAKTLSTEVAAQGITVNNVAPGYTATERLDEIFESEQDRTDLEGSIPAARFATPEEIAAAAVFLASQGAAYITGQTLVVDGGATRGVF